MGTMRYHKKEMRKLKKAGFVGHDCTLPDGTLLHYGEGPANDQPSLFLIHGQATCWEDFAPVLPLLSKDWHVFAVDCHGHGKSSKNPLKYTCKAMSDDFLWFIEHVIKEPVVVVGHASGGLIAALLAANAPDIVRGVLLEDATLFSSEQGERWEKSIAYVDLCEPTHRFLRQMDEKDWSLFYLKNCYWTKSFSEKNIEEIINRGKEFRNKYLGKPLQLTFMPRSINRVLLAMDNYDILYGDAFYNGSWLEELDQEAVLSQIECPSVLIRADSTVDKDGILLGSMSSEDARRAHDLMADNLLVTIKTKHSPHVDRPKEFVKLCNSLLTQPRLIPILSPFTSKTLLRNASIYF